MSKSRPPSLEDHIPSGVIFWRLHAGVGSVAPEAGDEQSGSFSHLQKHAAKIQSRILCEPQPLKLLHMYAVAVAYHQLHFTLLQPC